MDAEYSVRESTVNYGMFFYCHNCGNRMFSVNKDKMKFNGKLCPKCGRTLHFKKEEKE